MIFNVFYGEGHDSWRIHRNDTISVLVDVWVLYWIKNGGANLDPRYLRKYETILYDSTNINQIAMVLSMGLVQG